MSSGGVFKLICNDGKADRMIMATSLLNQRISDIMCARKRAGKSDITPTIVDLERTHIIFVNAHFKPFAAIGYEYNKVQPQSGTSALGNSVTFSIPQFGDFFHDMVCRQRISSFKAKEQDLPTPPKENEDWDGNAIQGSTDGVKTSYKYVDAFGQEYPASDDTTKTKYRNLVRYCEYPGDRLYQKVQFTVNGNPLDEYCDKTTSMLRKFHVSQDKLIGYKRLVGQEVPREGYSGPKICKVHDSNNVGQIRTTTAADATNNIPSYPQRSVHPSPNTSSTFMDANHPHSAHSKDEIKTKPKASATSGEHTNMSHGDARSSYMHVKRDFLSMCDGPQTPKLEQPALDIWNKLKFWFCNDARLAIASVSIPFGQRFVTIDLATSKQLCFEFPNLYLRQQHDTGSIDDSDLVNVRTVTYRPIFKAAGLEKEPDITNIELYVNNIFVNPEVHDIYIKRIGFSLIRVYRKHVVRTNHDSHDEKLLSQLKWPIEYMYIGLQPVWNVNENNQQQWRDWHRMTKTVDIVDDVWDLSEVGGGGHGGAAGTGDHHKTIQQTRIGQIVPNTYVKECPTAKTLSFSAHGIKIHDGFDQKFFSSYNPYHYGGSQICTPSDEGAMMINFSLYPGSYQPSGHMNLSRAREFFASWTTDYVHADTPADFIAIAIAINFLLITDGSAVLRYST